MYVLISLVHSWLRNTVHSVSEHTDEARRLRAEASGYVLTNAAVIGGTIMGAVKCLATIRAAEPFPIIVEEAGEVMEPTLVAVLAVESVQKLELIGDHRQLPI